MATEFVPGAQLPARVRAMMANQAGPDFAIGDATRAPLLQRFISTRSSSGCRGEVRVHPPQHFLCFLLLPRGHRSLRPTF